MPLKVLTVDDSKTIRMIVKKAFTPYDCELFEAENGVEGLACAAREKPDLIVLDITMPVMNGAEMLERMRKEEALAKIPVIMLTAESGKENVMKIIKLGVKDYMVKPFKGEQLIERVLRIVKLKPKQGVPENDHGAQKYFSFEDDIYRLTMPATVNRITAGEMEGALKARIKEMANSKKNKIVLDLSRVSEMSVSLVKLIVSIVNHCQSATINVRLMGSSGLGDELKEFKEMSAMAIAATFEEAKAAFLRRAE